MFQRHTCVESHLEGEAIRIARDEDSGVHANVSNRRDGDAQAGYGDVLLLPGPDAGDGVVDTMFLLGNIQRYLGSEFITGVQDDLHPDRVIEVPAFEGLVAFQQKAVGSGYRAGAFVRKLIRMDIITRCLVTMSSIIISIHDSSRESEGEEDRAHSVSYVMTIGGGRRPIRKFFRCIDDSRFGFGIKEP